MRIQYLPKQQQMEGQPLPETDQYTNSQQLTQEKSQSSIVQIKLNPDRKQYGNMLILFQKGKFILSLGPDYPCFLPTFVFFCVLSYFLCFAVNSNFQNFYIKAFALALGILQCGSYFLVAISNPGIVLPQSNLSTISVTEQIKNKFCKKCGAQVKRKTYHCRDCDVCVEGYDHHCPWTSKCIGKGNICQFYCFITVTPIYFLCLMFLMMGSLVISAKNAQIHHKLL